MLRFLAESAAFFAITAGATLPVTYVARMVKRRHNRRKWLGWAAFTAVAVAGIGWSSRDLQTGCRAERNEGCIDIGGVGSQVLVVGCFVAFALASAYMMWND